ncbi:MAG: carboxypeptidase-like regulatory domain-containing protein [Bacteroidales bacterium]|nr:carboxypeptidase-like regulatory domain-containing protein [Bacteroidales bacterium]MCF8387789.1 carboxypeptidase-like regulatory domain-containing protein [Bacteroidales bacterium]MCF8398153.1 carboxypeptidase-like regulatory domain-containing protein [Bacteroidales bacterium]
MFKLRKPFYLILFTILSIPVFAQSDDDLVQFSGVVVAGDSIQPIPFTNIIIANTNRGTVSDYYGYFSFVAKKLDTIVFSSIGFKKDTFMIPDTITGQWYSLIHVMKRDTVLLKETVIYPWPTVEQFKEAFLNLQIPDDEIEIARKNLDPVELARRAEDMRMSSRMNYQNFINQETSRLYYNGQTQPISILNPFAWAKFIKAWREGKFKRDKNK